MAHVLTYLLPGMPLAATKVLHFCLSLAIFSIVPQDWFIDFSSPSTVRLHVFFGLPRVRFPSVVHCSGVLVMAHVKIHKSKSQLKRLSSAKNAKFNSHKNERFSQYVKTTFLTGDILNLN